MVLAVIVIVMIIVITLTVTVAAPYQGDPGVCGEGSS